MSLEGSLETVALPEVLQLLSDTSKTGELLVRGDRGEGRLWFGQGRLTAFQVARTDQAADALFDLLRNGEGRFSFEADADRPEDAHHVGQDEGEVRPALELAQARLAEWIEIVAVVPSLQHVIRLAEESPRARLHLDSAQWGLIVAVGEGRTVQDILDRASLPEFDGCKSLKVLVDSGLATVSEPPAEALDEPVAAVEEPVAAEDDPVAAVEEPVAEAAEETADLIFEPAAEESVVEEHVEPVAAHEGESASELESADHYASEAALDPHEYVFSPSASSGSAEDPATEETAEENAEEVAPWSVGLADTSTNGADTDEYVPQPVPYPDGQAASEANGSQDARSALEALLAEIPGDNDGAESHEEAPDGLADRGPWTSHELAHMSSWQEEESQEVASWGSFQVTSSPASNDPEANATGGAPARFHEYREAATSDEAHQYSAEADGSEEPVEEEEPEQKPEQVNRGLLLKFLSSVRS